MARPLALHQTTVLQSTPLELVEIAADVGCAGICVFVHVPDHRGPGRPVFPRVTREMLPEMHARMQALGVGVTNLEYFPLTAETAPENYRASLELGALLGAQRAVAHLHDADASRGADTLARFCELAQEYRLTVGLEFIGLSAGCPNLQRALQIVRQLGLANLGIGVDALHLQRTGGAPGDLRGVERHLLSYAQLCDGIALDDPAQALDPARYIAEAFDRLSPSEGAFPLAELVAALPADLPFDVEVPALRLSGSAHAPSDHARNAVTNARGLLALAHSA